MTVVKLRRTTPEPSETHTVEAKCETCGVSRWYTKYDAARGRITPNCQPCSVAKYHSTRIKKTKEEKTQWRQQWYRQNKATSDAYSKLWRRQERMRLIESFGGMCSECGERDTIVLDFDHINNDGHKETNANIIFSVKRNPERFQLLCKNCNWRKEYWRRNSAKQE